MSDANARQVEEDRNLAGSSGPRPFPRTSSYPTTPPPPPESTSSWWRVLLSAPLSPPTLPTGFGESDRDRAVAYRIARQWTMFAFALPVLALVAILWSVPLALASIGIAVVIARIAVALGLLAVSAAFLRAGERLLIASSSARGHMETH